ncbi:MAG TPA: outer membrane lipoprotein chaperone LolA [Gemmatimonadota bacterium]|jgi:outer membrane lipoprotein carrier protein|nr:outer membrane lipoprotein chaperone LolA [Gemmatimonadota bacterium]
MTVIPDTTRRRFVFVALLVLAMPATAAPGQDPEAIAERADRALASLRTLEADFVQRVVNPVLEKTEIGHGTLYYRSPGRYRIEYTYPRGDVVVDDGTWVWIYLPSSQPDQVIRQAADGSGGANPLTYLRDLRSMYDVVLAGSEAISGETSDRLSMEPRAEDAPFTEVDVWVGRQTGLLRRVRTVTADGVEKSYTFTSLTPGARVADSRFRFSPPPGVEVYDQ